MKVNNIMCCELTQLALNKEYNKIWEHPRMQLIINATINKVLKNAKILDKNIIKDDVTSGVYIRLRELIDNYNPITKKGGIIEFYPYVYGIFSTYSFNVHYFVNTFKGAEFKQNARVFYMVSELAAVSGESENDYLDRVSNCYIDIDIDDVIENLINEQIEEEINNLSQFGQTVMKAALTYKNFSAAKKATGIHISGAFLEIQRLLKRNWKPKEGKTTKEGSVKYDLEGYKRILKLMLIKNGIDIDKYKNMLDY